MRGWFPQGELLVREWSAGTCLDLLERRFAQARPYLPVGKPILRGRVWREGDGGRFKLHVVPSGSMHGYITMVIHGSAEDAPQGAVIRYRTRFSWLTSVLLVLWTLLALGTALFLIIELGLAYRWEYIVLLVIPIPVYWSIRSVRGEVEAVLKEVRGWFGDRIVH